jgi:hypothetical protein
MERRNNILKEAVVFLIAVLMLLSIAAIATSNRINTIGSPKSEMNYISKNMLSSHLQNDVILWDNYVFSWKTAYHSQDDPPEAPHQWDSFVADDFRFEEETEVKWVFWQIYYGFAPGGKDYHYDWNITFFKDDGTGNSPGDIYEGPITISDSDIYKSLPYFNTSNSWACGAHTFLPEPVTFDADTKYWISVYSIGRIYPQTFFPCHNESDGGILLHEGKFKSEYFGYPEWTDLSVLDDEPLDSNFILGGDPPTEVTLNKGLGVTATIADNTPEGYPPMINVTVNFTATGGFVLNPTKTVVIPEIAPQTAGTAKYFPIGFGKITVTVDIILADIGVPSTEIEGRLLLILLL